MTIKQKEKCQKLEQQMREEAAAIISLTTEIETISDVAAAAALEGIIQYLKEKQTTLLS